MDEFCKTSGDWLKRIVSLQDQGMPLVDEEIDKDDQPHIDLLLLEGLIYAQSNNGSDFFFYATEAGRAEIAGG